MFLKETTFVGNLVNKAGLTFTDYRIQAPQEMNSLDQLNRREFIYAYLLSSGISVEEISNFYYLHSKYLRKQLKIVEEKLKETYTANFFRVRFSKLPQIEAPLEKIPVNRIKNLAVKTTANLMLPKRKRVKEPVSLLNEEEKY